MTWKKRPPRVIISVISDLVSDQRIHRSALTLQEMNFNVAVIGRRMRNSQPMGVRPYYFRRFKLWYEKGPLFYAVYNIRLFLFLLFTPADVFLANDLDTLPANYLASKIRGIPLVYDSHEYFTEVPELISRPSVRNIWLRIERWIFPRLRHVFTVNESIAAIYKEKYNVPVRVVRNLPLRNKSEKKIRRSDWNIPDDIRLFLFQGAGINIHRGAEEAMEAIQSVPGAALLFIGAGDVFDKVNEARAKWKDKIYVIPKQPFQSLAAFTRMADFGLTLDKDNNPNYRFSLPNKLFDYIQAGLPILATNLPEVQRIITDYDVGLIIEDSDPAKIAVGMREMMANVVRLDRWKMNLKIAAEELCWENEKNKLIKVFEDVEQS